VVRTDDLIEEKIKLKLEKQKSALGRIFLCDETLKT